MIIERGNGADINTMIVVCKGSRQDKYYSESSYASTLGASAGEKRAQDMSYLQELALNITPVCVAKFSFEKFFSAVAAAV
jgi:DNA mismatch repair protein MutH